MGRAPCCDKSKVKRGPWSIEEDTLLRNFIHAHGTGGNWISLPNKAGLNRCGKSCRLRWLNYLRPDIKHGGFTDEEDYLICNLYSSIGSRWSVIASKLPGRTDNDVKNYWNTKLKKKIAAGKVPDFDNKLNFSANGNKNGSEIIPEPEKIGLSCVQETVMQVSEGQAWDPLEICNGVNSGCTNSSVSWGSSSVQDVGNGGEDDIDDFWLKLFVDQSTFVNESSPQDVRRYHEMVNELASVVRGP